ASTARTYGIPSAISACGGSPCRRRVASSPGRSSEVVTPIRGLMTLRIDAQRRNLYRQVDSNRPLAIGRMLIPNERRAGTIDPPQYRQRDRVSRIGQATCGNPADG